VGTVSGEALVREFYDRVRRYVCLRVPDGDGDDVVAEVFLRALARRGQLRGDDPGPWLFRITRSRVAEYHEARAARAAREERMQRESRSATAPATPLEALEQAEFRARFRRRLAVLSEVERDLIALKFTDGLTNGQIALALGVTANHLGVMLHRALARLRSAMLEEATHGVP
jgi:RNA polymerase sigma-70 factor (ECF subfamily)